MQNAQCTLYSVSEKLYLATAHIRNGKNSCNGPVVIIRTWENTRAKRQCVWLLRKQSAAETSKCYNVNCLRQWPSRRRLLSGPTVYFKSMRRNNSRHFVTVDRVFLAYFLERSHLFTSWDQQCMFSNINKLYWTRSLIESVLQNHSKYTDNFNILVIKWSIQWPHNFFQTKDERFFQVNVWILGSEYTFTSICRTFYSQSWGG